MEEDARIMVGDTGDGLQSRDTAGVGSFTSVKNLVEDFGQRISPQENIFEWDNVLADNIEDTTSSGPPDFSNGWTVGAVASVTTTGALNAASIVGTDSELDIRAATASGSDIAFRDGFADGDQFADRSPHPWSLGLEPPIDAVDRVAGIVAVGVA